MRIFPAIDLFGGKCVRLYKGNYDEMTVYSEHPEEIAREFESAGASDIHLVDLEGAKSGQTPNIETVKKIIASTNLSAEIGGGIRSMEVIEAYISSGAKRVILGTSAVEDRPFLKQAIDTYGESIAVGVDIKDGYVAVKGWTEKSEYKYNEFCQEMQSLGVKTLICTDISKDGAMKGTNLELYKDLSENYSMNIIASGGVSSIEDVKNLAKLDIYGAIIGKAYYTGAISISDAVSVCKGENV